ncbi:ATP-binding protein [Streptomyces sp. NPDC097619]|uniref:ATP-binding protein n=1 Tax=Streptomyces sp. NPDC097619 TaxID=3157228 RepID=UPI003319479E
MRVELTVTQSHSAVPYEESAMLSLSALPCLTIPAGGTVPAGPPDPQNLFCSLTLPGAPHAARIARGAVTVALHTHGLAPLAAATVQATSELVAAAAKLSPGEDLYLSLRYRTGTVRLTAFDGQAARARTPLAEALDTRRRAALRFLACLVRECSGSWGFEPSREPGGGTRTWVCLPHEGAADYGAFAAEPRAGRGRRG